MISESRLASDIAIVGMAGLFPEADSVHALSENLRRGRDSVRELSLARKSRTSLSLAEDYQVCGYIEEIDTFDHSFFGISKGEAQFMAPQQRLLLQVAYQAVENAGYAPDSLNGLRASIYAGDTRLEYDLLARSFEPMLMMGNHASATVGRIARFFGLRGPVAMVDSSCSSSLLAVHLAMNDLRLGEAELALACGVNLNLFPDRRSGEPDIGIKSADGKTRCFSAEAAGTGSGEAVACVVLKRLDQALRDGDLIHAVIKAIAVNHVAGRSSTLTAPDSNAQAEVLESAWRKAGIDPATISYIEAHGTATRLGDPIEIEAIDLAFGRATSEKHFCALSSVKSNLGHTWSAAGIVGLLKAVLSLKHRVLFPSLHSATLSPLIDFAGSAVVVTQELTAWEPRCGVRRAGVSSFGVMGTNVHAVLEEAPRREEAALRTESPAGARWIPVSAKSAAALDANLAALKDWIDGHPDLQLADIAHTLVRGRSHFAHRFCVTAADTAAFLAALSAALSAPGSCRSAPEDGVPVVGVLLLSGRYEVRPETVRSLRRTQPHFDALYTLCEQAAGADAEHPRTRHFAFQYAFSGLLRHIGLEVRHRLGEGAGKHVLDAAAGRVELGEALRRALDESDAGAADLEARVDRLLAKLGGEGRLLFIEAGPLSTVSGALAARRGAGYSVVHLTEGADSFAAYLRDLYLAGASWDWVATAGGGRRIELPSYQFQRIRCWMEDAIVPSSPEVQNKNRIETPAESALDGVRAVWQEILGLEELSDEDSFLDLGGDSISGMQVINRLQTLFGIELGDDAFFEHETPLALAQHVEEVRKARRQREEPPPAVPPEEEFFATSPAQLHIWLASRFEGGSVAFNLGRSFRLAGTLESGALRRALQALAARHEALRCVFSFIDGTLVQRALPADRFLVPLEERSLDEPVPDASRLAARIRELVARPFDLEQGPLLRAQLLRFRGDESVLTYSTHHIVADGWSLDLLTRDLFAFYAAEAWGAPLALPPLGTAYRDHHQRQANEEHGRREAAAGYWLARFDEEIAPLDLPRQPALSGAPFRGAYRGYALPAPLSGRLKRFSQTEGGTVFAAVLSAFAALFSRHAESGEMVLGTSAAGRGTEAVEQLVGMFVRTLPLRLRVEPRQSFRELFGHVRSTFGEALRHATYPYEELVEELRRRGRTHAARLFDVLIEFEQFAASAPAPLEATPLEVTLETSFLPLNIMLSGQDGGLEASIRFDTSLFDAAAVDQLWEGFVRLLDAALEHPDAALDELRLLSEEEQLQIRMLGHRSLAFDPALRVHRAIESFAVRTPERVCLSCGGEERTYAELNARANQLARFFLRCCQVRPEEPQEPQEIIALVMDRSILMVESILALWKCGAAYLPISPGSAPSLVRTILETSKVRMVAVDPSRVSPELSGQIPSGCQLLPLEPGTASDESRADLDLLDLPLDSSLAYVIYTSGSTGVPKGAMIEQPGLLNHLHAKIADLALSERSVVVQNASNSFDISVWQMFAAPFTGGRTVIYDEPLQLDPLRFAARLDADRITVLEVVPSYLETLLDAWDLAGRTLPLDSLEALLVTGETVLPALVNRWLRRFPKKAVINAYGPTETSDDVTHHRITGIIETVSVPLGRPIPNTRIYLLDESGRLCPPGIKGEICAAGICVGRGYLNDPAQTARAFVPDPFEPGRRLYRTGDIGRWSAEGTLEFFGRRDGQVKVRGFRIELGEVERRLSECPAVKAAVVVKKREGADPRSRLCAYVVPAPGRAVGECRAFLSRELPEPMIPTDFVAIDRLPLTPNGKVDRKALEALALPETASEPALQPRTETEKTLAEIWEQVLGRDGIGVTDRFLDVGGNSLRAMQILARVRSRLGVDLELEAMFRQPTIADLAARLSTAQARAADPIPSLGGAGVYDIAARQEILLRIEETSEHRDAFNRNDLYRLGGVDPDRLEHSFARLIERHESLRTTYGEVNGRPAQIVHEPGALALPFRVHDFSQDAEPLDAVHRFCASRIRTPFEISREPLVRVDLMQVGADEFFLLTSMHQLISDGRSVDVFLDDWLALYEGSGCETLSLQYKDIAAWRNRRLTPERLCELRAFWTRELAGASSILPLRTDRPRPSRPSMSALAGERLSLELPAALSARIAALAGDHGVTEFVVACCAVSQLLIAETGQSDITLGTYTRGRNRVDLEDQIGFFIHTVPLRFQAAPDDSVRSLLARAQDGVLRAFQHEEYPYGWTMKDLGWSRGPERARLFDVMIAMDEAEGAAGESARRPRRLAFDRQSLPRRAKEADLLFAFARSGDRLEIAVTYNTELFTPPHVQQRLAAVRAILEAMVADRPWNGGTEHE